MIEITISKEGEVKIKVDNQAQSVSVSTSEVKSVKKGFSEFQHEVNEAIKNGDIKVNRIIPSEDCRRQNICGYEPKNYQNKPGCKSGEIEGGPTY